MLLEAVANLSLAPGSRGLEAVEAALERERSPGWALLDLHSDADHGRSVLTMAGAPAPLLRALVAMVEAAARSGTLRGHKGVHPRVGLIDVVPVVALADAHEADAARVAHGVAQCLARLDVPVYFYGSLARNVERAALAFLRRGLGAVVGERAPVPLEPDLGPSALHPELGAACVGVRPPLVAYNVLLDTTDHGLGREIARGLRDPKGGLAGVQALAFALPSRGGLVQVSCNLTRLSRAGPADVFAFVERAARAQGVRPIAGELVGLAPEAALALGPGAMGLQARPVSLEEHLRGRGFPQAPPR